MGRRRPIAAVAASFVVLLAFQAFVSAADEKQAADFKAALADAEVSTVRAGNAWPTKLLEPEIREWSLPGTPFPRVPDAPSVSHGKGR